LLPRATRTDDILAWHVRQVRAHFAQHVIPLLSGCVADDADDDDEEVGEAGDDGAGNGRWHAARKGSNYERHMVTVMSSIRTLEAALRLYFYGLHQLLSGLSRLADSSPGLAQDAELLNTRFQRDTHALVSNSASEGLMRSIKAVLIRLVGTILGFPAQEEHRGVGGQAPRPAPPGPDDLRVQAARERLLELVQQLHNVGLAGERFQVLFAEVMDLMMSAFVTGAYGGVWSAQDRGSFSVAMDTVSRSGPLSAASPCIMSLSGWVENHFARLSLEVLHCISSDPQAPLPVSLADVQTYQSLALGRLAALRVQELFDIVLAWPASRPALDDLRATITTAARRRLLTDDFSRSLQIRLLHPGRSTLEILQTYIAIIRTLHALDPSKVLLSHVEPRLQLYLCHREDAVRVVVSGLLASPEEIRAATKTEEVAKRPREKSQRDGPSSVEVEVDENREPSNDNYSRRPTKLVELALLLNDPAQNRRMAADLDEDLDWNDMNWVPDPVDAGANYKRPKSEDVVGTIISALGNEEVFIKEFSVVVAERLLSEPTRFDQELRVLDLLKRRFGEAALQNCDVMIKDVQDSRKVDTAIHRARAGQRGRALVTPDKTAANRGGQEIDYHARILSRLFWPNLDREHFLLPQPVAQQQTLYEQGYESLKSRRKLTWLNQLGQARVELELRDRTVAVDCNPVEATVIYAFQGAEDDGDGNAPPVQKSVDELYEQLQMDEDLIAAALRFWVSKGVLRRVAGSKNRYIVAETLHNPAASTATVLPTAFAKDEEGQQHATTETEAPELSTAAGAKPAVSAKERERRELYWRYIQGMLKNVSASMPLGQMAMMMKISIGDGFSWSNEELQDFLAEKVAGGDLEVVGGKYKLVKKK
jgi:anaphase-promoting complex subunit 2